MVVAPVVDNELDSAAVDAAARHEVASEACGQDDLCAATRAVGAAQADW